LSDIFDSEKRSEIMSKIRGKNTKPELIVYAYLRKEKVYFQKHYRTKQGIVLDVAQPRKKKAVFIDGDFWHGRTLEKIRSRRGDDDFWTKKLERNIERDNEQYTKLVGAGWSIKRVWESDILKKATCEKTLIDLVVFLRSATNSD